MNANIDNMISRQGIPVNGIIDRQGEGQQGTVFRDLGYSGRCGGIHKVPGNRPDFFNAGVIKNPVKIIQMKGIVKRIGINSAG